MVAAAGPADGDAGAEGAAQGAAGDDLRHPPGPEHGALPQQERVGEGRSDLLDVVGHQDQRRTAAAPRQQIEEALAVCFSFNVIGRLADAFGFFVPGSKSFEAGAKYLLSRGYR